MSDTKRLLQFEANKKSVGVAYLLWFFFALFGVHRFYVGKNGSAAIILALTIVSILTSFIGIGLFLFLIPGIWVFIDLFLIPGMVSEYNNQLINMMNL